MGLTRKRARAERGAAAVEFALLVPILFTLVFGIIDFGWAINRNTVVNNAAREGVRLASLGEDSSRISTSVQSALNDMGLDASTVSVNLSCLKPDGTACGTWGERAPGGTAIITVRYSTAWITPVGSAFASNLSISKSSRMRIE